MTKLSAKLTDIIYTSVVDSDTDSNGFINFGYANNYGVPIVYLPDSGQTAKLLHPFVNDINIAYGKFTDVNGNTLVGTRVKGTVIRIRY